MTRRKWISTISLISVLAMSGPSLGCSPRLAANFPEQVELWGSDGRAHFLNQEVSRSRLSVFVFFAKDCPCVSAHEARLAQLYAEFQTHGVQFFAVNSERGAQASSDAAQAKQRGYPYPLLTDADSRLARSLGAEFATHTIVVDADGNVVYSGGIDSDKNEIHADATFYLKDVLNDLLAGRTPRHFDTEAMGCVLRLN